MCVRDGTLSPPCPIVVVASETEALRTTNTGWLLTMATGGLWAPLPPNRGAPRQPLPLPEGSRPLVLFPGGERVLSVGDAGRPLVMVDAGYRRARRMLRRPPLVGLDRARLPDSHATPTYRLRNSRDPTRLCTMGAAARALEVVGATEDAAALDALLAEFQERAWRLRHLSAG